MKSQKKVTVVFGIIFAAAVLFFIAILVLASTQSGNTTSPKVRDDAMTITEMRVDTVWKNDRSCSVTQKLDVVFNEPRHGIYVDIPVNSGERVRNLNVDVKDGRGNAVNYEVGHESNGNIVRVKVGDADRYLNKNSKLACTLKYDYVTPVHPDGANILDINPIGYGWACEIKDAFVSVTFPTALKSGDLHVWVSGKEISPALSDGGKTVSLQTGKLSPFHGVRVKAEMPDGILESYGFEGIATIVVGIVIAVAAVLLMVFLGKDKPLTPVVNFYPPMTDGKTGRKRRMLPTQLGKLIDGKCSEEDVTSLIFYWASEGYIKIDESGSDTFLVKLKQLDPITEYERNLFNALFRDAEKVETGNGEIKRIGLRSLSGNFASNILAAQAAANVEFGKFYKNGFNTLSVVTAFCAAIFAVLGSVLATMRIHVLFFNFVGIITVAPVILAYALGSLLVRTYFKIDDTRRKAFLALFFVSVILLSVAVMLAVPTDAMSWAEKIVFALGIGVTSAIAPFLTRRTDKYTEQLNDIIGFRNFLRDAEKDKLETLIADDPQYYYSILPYANVLGVSDIWQDKFADLKMEPPVYYRGSNMSVFDIYVVSRLSRSIGSSLTYTPATRSPSSGSFSGGHGGFGGGHGGGGSFGGFGGGGGGSW